MFLFENSVISYSQKIRGVQYITNSFYGGDQDIFQLLERLISQSLPSSDPAKVTKGSLVVSDMALKAG